MSFRSDTEFGRTIELLSVFLEQGEVRGARVKRAP